MEFNEYEYLEKVVEPVAPPTNGSSSDAKDRGSCRYKGGEDRASKRSLSREDRDRTGTAVAMSTGTKTKTETGMTARIRRRAATAAGRTGTERGVTGRRRGVIGTGPEIRRWNGSGGAGAVQSGARRGGDGEGAGAQRSECGQYCDRDVRRSKNDGAEPEVDPERDQRTVMCRRRKDDGADACVRTIWTSGACSTASRSNDWTLQRLRFYLESSDGFAGYGSVPPDWPNTPGARI